MCRCDEVFACQWTFDFCHCFQLNLFSWLLTGQQEVGVNGTTTCCQGDVLWTWNSPPCHVHERGPRRFKRNCALFCNFGFLVFLIRDLLCHTCVTQCLMSHDILMMSLQRHCARLQARLVDHVFAHGVTTVAVFLAS